VKRQDQNTGRPASMADNEVVLDKTGLSVVSTTTQVRPGFEHRAEIPGKSGRFYPGASRPAAVEIQAVEIQMERPNTPGCSRSAGIGRRCTGDVVAGATRYLDSSATRALD